jgi:hypothetical protein
MLETSATVDFIAALLAGASGFDVELEESRRIHRPGASGALDGVTTLSV